MSAKIIGRIVIVVLLCVFGCGNAYALVSTSAKATIIAIDENGEAVSGANASIIFEKNKPGGFGIDVYPSTGLTDAEGKFIAEYANDNGVIAYNVEKIGYYRSIGEYRYSSKVSGQWMPWNPELKIVMRKIENQVPMYIRDTKMYKKRVEIPVVGKDVGFDLIAYDWVPPYGNGKYSDFTFHLKSHIFSERDYEYNVTLKFDDSNGTQAFIEDINHGSVFKLPRYAPEVGYIKELKFFTRRRPGKQIERSRTEGFNYIFRVRSKVKDGKVTEAIYGKILGDFYVRPRADDKAEIEFVYYLNPDRTRNLEHDPKRNLFYE